MKYETKNFEYLLGLPGFSDTLLKNHFALYQGYVNNVNKFSEQMSAFFGEGKTASPEYAELKRRFGWEYNGMRLHELYFGNLSKNSVPLNQDSDSAKMIKSVAGSVEIWEKEFRAAAAMRGIGWVVLYFDTTSKNLFNVWVNEHDVGHLSGAIPLLVMDVFEHAYMTDYGIKKADYIDAFFKAIDWGVVDSRLKEVL